MLVHNNEAVGVAVQRKAHVCPNLAHLGRHQLGVERATVLIDVGAVGGCANAKNLCPQFFKRQRGNLVAGPVGAVNHNAQARKGQLRGKTAFCVNNVAATGVFNLGGAAYTARFGEGPLEIFVKHHCRNFVFRHVGQLVALGVKKLDAVVVEGIVRSGDNHAKVGPHAAGKKGYGRGGQGACHDNMHASGTQACGKR